MVSALIGLALVSLHQGPGGPNLLVNPGLVREWEGWTGIWAREDGAAQVSIVPGEKGDARAIFVKHTGSKDWALSQQQMLPVKPGDLYEISARMKSDGGHNTISVVTRDAAGTTLDWTLGAVGPKAPGWQSVRRRFMIPAACQTVQFRVVGEGPGQTWVESPSLARFGAASASNLAPVSIKGSSLTLKISGDGSIVATPKAGRAWRYKPLSADCLVKSLKRIDARTAKLELLFLADDLPVSVLYKVDEQRPEATLSCVATGALAQDLALIGSVVTEPAQAVILPMNEGIRFPVEDATVRDWSLITYGGHGLCMPWSGVIEPKTGAGAMSIIESPDDADVLYPQENGLLSFQPRWEPTKGAFGYERKLRLAYFSSGGYVAMAKRYRAHAKQTGLFKTLAAKERENPNIDRLIGAVNIWNWDLDKVALCKEMKQMGFSHVLWSSGGSADQIRAIAELGYLPGRYDIYQDVWDPKHSLSWQNTEGWPEDLVLEPNGDWMKGWAHPDKHADGSITWYQGGVISSGAGLTRAKQNIPADLAKTPYLSRFIDTTTASPFREDYNPAHPLTRTQDRANKMKLLEFCSKDMKQVVGTETGIDPSVPVVEYYEGMMSLGPFRLPNAGTFMMNYEKPTPDFLKFQVGPGYRIPLWELVYHDCTVAQWYWGDATNKAPEVWDQRDLLNILYGTAPLLMFDKERWDRDKARMLQTYRNVCEWTRKIGYDEMLTHEDITPDHLVQRTTWSSGRSVVVNFGDKSFHGIAPHSYLISGKS